MNHIAKLLGWLAPPALTIPVALLAAPVPNGCTATVDSINFGTYRAELASSTDAMGTVNLQCNGQSGRRVSVGVSLSAGRSGNYTARQMLRPGGASLSYNIYLNGARSVVWGDGTGGSSTYSGSIIPLLAPTLKLPLYARLPARQNAAPGAYLDTISVIVDYN